MGEFDFYFTYYGLLLSLSGGTVIIRFADTIGERNGRSIGWLSPLLGTFILLDITSFWIWAWRARPTFHITYTNMYFGLAVAAAYFFSSSQVFPKEGSDWKTLDEHYWARKRFVLPGIIFANLAVILQSAYNGAFVFDRTFFIQQPFYWIPLVALLFTRNKWVDLALLAELCLFYTAGSVIFGW
jgi:hypothetical protein